MYTDLVNDQSPNNNKYVENKAVNTPNRTISQEGINKKDYVKNKAVNTQNGNDRMHFQAGHIISPEMSSLLQVQPMFGVVIYDSQPSHHDPTVEDCGPDEEYFSCGWCEPSCSEPSPNCPNKVCIRGCLCRPPLLRHHTGQCVDSRDCYPEKCSSPNEEYVCLYGCELRCDGICRRPRYCVLGCFCRIGLLRDNNGHCVIKERCSNSTEVQGRPVNYDRTTVVNYDRTTAVNYDRSTAVNYDKGPSVNHHIIPIDFEKEKILGSKEPFILVPVL